MKQRAKAAIPDDLIICNGAGTAKTFADVERLCKSAVTHIRVGSITPDYREGNRGVGPYGTYYYNPDTGESGNALGLNNVGLAAFLRVAPQMIALAHAHGKKLIASVAGNSVREIAALVTACLAVGCDGVEINFGCPNVHDGGVRHQIFSYAPPLFFRALVSVRAALSADWRQGGQTLAVKVSPVVDPPTVRALANAVSATGIIDEIVAVNSDPDHRFILPDGSDALAYIPPGSDQVMHLGGKAGAPLKPARREAVRLWRKNLPNHKITALGGVFTGKDVFEAIHEDGADGFGCAFGCATAYLESGERIFSKICEEYVREHTEVFGGALTV
jgi:dihydroorotate dehydrogenase